MDAAEYTIQRTVVRAAARWTPFESRLVTVEHRLDQPIRSYDVAVAADLQGWSIVPSYLVWVTVEDGETRVVDARTHNEP